jgi:hypothetical protein
MRFLACFKDRNFINKAFSVKKINILFSIDKSQIPKCHCKTDVLTACANGPILLFIDDPPYFIRKYYWLICYERKTLLAGLK